MKKPQTCLIAFGAEISLRLTIFCVAASLYKLGRIDECEVTLEKAYHLIRNCFSNVRWKKWRDVRIGEYRNAYE